jgi:hypothetical protein
MDCEKKLIERGKAFGWKGVWQNEELVFYKVIGNVKQDSRNSNWWFEEVQIPLITKELLLVAEPAVQKIFFNFMMSALDKSDRARGIFKDLLRAEKAFSLLGEDVNDFNETLPV